MKLILFFAYSVIGLSTELPNKLAVNDAAICFLDQGNLWCWGTNSSGQLGLGNADPHWSPTPVFESSNSRRMESIYAGEDHLCAAFSNGRVKCWGSNESGQLGLGAYDSLWGAYSGQTPSNAPFIELGKGKVRKLALGGAHTCALFVEGTIKCWGLNRSGQLGLGHFLNRGKRPWHMGENLPTVPTGGIAVDLCAGERHTCVLLEAGNVKCWGDAAAIGSGDTKDIGGNASDMKQLPFIDLGTDEKAISLSCGNESTCAILESGKLKCWGNNPYGVLGAGSTTLNIGTLPGQMGSALMPVRLGPLYTTNTSCNGNHCCAILENNVPKCWGENNYGELGLGDRTSRGHRPEDMGVALPVLDLGAFKKTLEIRMTHSRTCARVQDLTDASECVKCWGHVRNKKGDYQTIGANELEMGDRLPCIPLPKTKKPILAHMNR